jgi:metal-responsive CopG/Arc/MetJ family transcriptional regulator
MLGRPLKHSQPMVQIAIRFPPDMIAALDAIVADGMGATDRATLIREATAALIKARRGKS